MIILVFMRQNYEFLFLYPKLFSKFFIDIWKINIIIWCLYYIWFNFAKVSNFGKVNTAKTTEIAIFCIKLMYSICKILPVLTSKEEKNIKKYTFL